MKVLILTIIFFSFRLPGSAQEVYKITLNSILIKGTSNVHKWEEKVGQLNGTVTLVIEGEQIKALSEANFDIPVKSIKSSKGNIMDNKTYQSLKSDDCPSIKLKLQKCTIAGNDLKADASMQIACASKNIELVATIKPVGNNQFTIAGSKKLKMTDFGIKPPTALLGTMVTGDEITIEFDIKLTK